MEKKNPQRPKVIKRRDDYLNLNIHKDKNRYSIYETGVRNSGQVQNYKTIHKKSLQINNTQPVRGLNTITQLSRPVYRRISYHQKSITTSKRYEQQEHQEIRSRASPYMKKQLHLHQLGRTTILNRSSGKIKSGNLTKQLSPYQLYKQPRSSLSQHYDPIMDTSLHKRRQSYMEQKQEALKMARQFYKNNQFDKCCEFLRKHLRSNPSADGMEGNYLLGMSLINMSDHRGGIQALEKVVRLNPQYKKTVYLIMGLAYKKLGMYKQAIQILSKGLQFYPDYYDLVIYRGKMYLKQQEFERSREDFSIAIELNRHKGFAYLGKGTSQLKMNLIEQAINTFTEGISTDLAHVCYQKRAIAYYQQKHYKKALKDLQQASLYDQYISSPLHYYKGMILYHQNNFTQALLSFQQALKCDNNQQLVTLAVQMMLKIKIQDKDFYQAYHLVNRADNVDVDKDVINDWKLFLQASLFLMKKKYKDGLLLYQNLEKKALYQYEFSSIKKESQKQRYKFIKPLIHLYKAFGYLSENNPEKALLEYEYHSAVCRSIGIRSDNLSKRYNSLIVEASKNFPRNVTDLLIEARELIPTKPEPYLFLSFDCLHQVLKADSNQIQKKQKMASIIDYLTTGISHLPQLSNNHISSFYYFRSIIYLYLQEFSKAVTDIDKAIQKSQDNIPKYFYLRGLIFACFGNFSQAVQDFSVAINLDQKYPKPYLERAKCLQIQGNSNQAFIDLQKYITLAPQDPLIHKYAGFLLFQNCAYQDCLSAFSHGSELPKDQELILTKGKCNFLLGHYDVAIEYFEQFGNKSGQQTFERDVEIIKICNEVSKVKENDKMKELIERIQRIEGDFKEQDSKIFKIRDLHQIKGSIYLIGSQYDLALEQFNKTLDYFRIEKQKEFQKNLVEDLNEFQQEWSEIQIKFNISLCHLCKQQYDIAYQLVAQFADSTEKGKNWDSYVELIQDLLMDKDKSKNLLLDTFQQNIRISKKWPKISIPNTNINLSMAFSYPFVEPPQMMPQFDEQLFSQFCMKKVEPKPEAPWINRNQCGLVFTPNIQVYDNLELSMTTKKNEDEFNEHKPSSQIEQSISLSNSEFQLPTEDLKKKFKLDSLVEMKLKRIMNK